MQAVLDSVSLQHLLRSLKLAHSQRAQFKTIIDQYLEVGKLTLAVDPDFGLIDEWIRTCGEENVKVLITQWEPLDVIHTVNLVNRVLPAISRKLRILGFDDTIDKLILRIAINTNDRVVVSEDSDFWDPSDATQRGNSGAAVARLCTDELQVKVLLISGLIALL